MSNDYLSLVDISKKMDQTKVLSQCNKTPESADKIIFDFAMAQNSNIELPKICSNDEIPGYVKNVGVDILPEDYKDHLENPKLEN